ILTNPRYTGHEVWARQRRDEVLVDVDDVALGYEIKMRWNAKEDWVWSNDVVHEPLISAEVFDRAQAIASTGMHRPTNNKTHRTRNIYALSGLMNCGLCGRRMQGQQNHGAAHYRCRFAYEYALANKVDHPRNVYLRERDVLPALDAWLAS